MNHHERIRAGGAVRRYHTRTTIGHQSVAEHSWGVAAIILEICENPSRRLIEAAIYHDVAEYDTGDVPAQVKRVAAIRGPMLAFEADVEHDLGIDVELTEDEGAILKFADTMELLFYVLDQRRLGNTTLDDIWKRGWTYLDLTGMDPVVADQASRMSNAAFETFLALTKQEPTP